jgi:hypothetical protein
MSHIFALRKINRMYCHGYAGNGPARADSTRICCMK